MRFGNLTLNYCVQLLIHHLLLPLFLTPSGCGSDIFWVEMEETIGKVLRNREGCLGFSMATHRCWVWAF